MNIYELTYRRRSDGKLYRAKILGHSVSDAIKNLKLLTDGTEEASVFVVRAVIIKE